MHFKCEQSRSRKPLTHKAVVSSPVSYSYVHSQKQTSTAAQATSSHLIDDH
jgi:hypothetical protein